VHEVIAVAVFIACYVLIATEKVDRVAVALGGATVMLGLRVVNVDDAFHSEKYGVDWAVISLLLGMMVIVGVLAQTGLFDYLGIRAAQRARGRPFAILTMLVLITAVASSLLDNVTTVLLVAPVTIQITRRLGVPPVPFLIAEALASNIGGAATLVGDPPNIIIASRAGLSYADFLVHLAPLVVVLLLAFVLASRWLFRQALVTHPERIDELMRLDASASLTDRSLLIRGLAVLGLVTVAFMLHAITHLEPAAVALVGAGVLLLIARRDPKQFLAHVEWSTLAFFVGLFVMVGALVKTGAVDRVATTLADATAGHVPRATMLLLGASAVLSAIVDNIPYVATMAPVTATLIADLHSGHDPNVLWWALALGADLGGNATIIGASANVVIAGAAAKAGYPIRFVEFAKYGIPVTLLTILLTAGYLWLRYIVLGGAA
jgi:Na+/H+ antiporter NhaD/arsenite permease-like protein